MQSKATTVEDYIKELPNERKEAITKLRKVIKKNLPKGFKEEMNYGNIGYVVPHSKYPAGYHCDPKLPLPFIGLASQKNSINFYHMGMYANPALLKWFIGAHAQASTKRLDMGKSCIRFKNPEDIPYKLLGELVAKITVDDWVEMYETILKNSRKKK